MKLLIMSDLHFEFYEDKGMAFIDSLDSTDVDAIVLAGDISNISKDEKDIEIALGEFSKKFPHVLYVEGNHEFWGSSREKVIAAIESAVSKFNNVKWLSNKVVEICGRRFLGTPLWFFRPTNEFGSKTNCFHEIENFDTWVYDENKKCISFLVDNLQEGDIVISHYLPSKKCIHGKFKFDPINNYFVCDVEVLIKDRNPAIWIYGHTHESMQFHINETSMICNPYGYNSYNENYHFNKNFVIEV